MPVVKNEKDEHYYNAAYFTDEDFAVTRRAWRKALCGDEETNNINEPIIRQMLAIYDNIALETAAKMNRGEDIPILFGEKPPVESGEICVQYHHIRQMATAYGMYGCKSYHSPKLFKDIVYALDWMEEHMYGAQVLSDTSFRSYLAYNWWDWYIGGAIPMLETVMILEEGLTRKQIDKYVLPMSFLRTQMRLGNNAEMAVGQIMPCIPLALLTNDKALLQSMYLAMGKLLESHEEGDNMRADWCCMTHGMPYNLVYGQSNLDRVAYILQILSATPLNFPLKDKYNLMNMVRYSFAPALYHGRGLQSMEGRGMQTDDDAFTALRLCSSLRFLFGVFGEKEDKELYSIIRRHATPYIKKGILGYDTQKLIKGEEPVLESMPTVGITAYNTYKRILTEDEGQMQPYELAYMWRSGDTAVQHHKDVCMCLRMNSERVFGYECINHMNTDGFYTGDGHLYVYLPGQEAQYSIDYWKYVDKYHIPGVTADTQIREAKSIVDCFAYYSDRAFTGGVTLDNIYLTAAMDFRSFHNEKVYLEEDIGYGSGLPLHNCTLQGHKAWFFMDKATVALGAGIFAHDGFEVHTTVENRMLTEHRDIYIDGKRISDENGVINCHQVHWICIDGVCGYVFLQSATIVLRRCTHENGAVFVTIWINHGVNPDNASYAYVLLPLASNAQTQHYANAPDVQVLAECNGCLAVKEISSQLSGFAFFEAGKAENLIADTPLILMRNNQTGSLSVCDPTQKQNYLQFSVENASLYRSTDEAIQVLNTKQIKVDTKQAYGKAFHMTVTQKI